MVSMQIVKKFIIKEVKATIISNAPFQIILQNGLSELEEESSLILNSDTCTRYNIPMSLDLINRALICSFESYELPLRNDESLKRDVNIKDNYLRINSLEKNEIISSSLMMIPPSKHRKTLQTLKLSSFNSGDGIHLSPLPCPFYRMIIELNNKEYKICKALPPTSIFKVNFRLT